MLKNLTLKQTSAFMAVLLLIAGGGFIIASVYINIEVRTVKDAWTEFQVVRSEKARLGGQLRAALGYGGMIHNIKNYVLRGGDPLRDVARLQIGGVSMVLDQYEQLPLNVTERAALENIQATMTAYEKALDVIETMKSGGESAVNIDASIKVDDSLALRGLETLRLESVPHDRGAPRSKAVLISEIQALVGYGGMIHGFKNFVLRGQDEYNEKATAYISDIKDVIARYRNFDLSLGESNALDDMLRMLDAYHGALENIRPMTEEGLSVENIDDNVKINDGPALRALRLLVQEANLGILKRSQAMDTSLRKIANAEQAITMAEILLILIVTAFLMWVLRKQIIAPLKSMTDNMSRIAVGDYDVNIPDPTGNNEISEMTRNLQVLLNNSIKRHEVEQHLEETNTEMNQQLLEMQHLREQADEQAADAVGMAENLVFATEEAEQAKAKAEADERRTRAIMNTVTDAIITANAKGEIETFNMGAQTIFGYTPDEIIGRNVSFLTPEPLRSNHDGYMKAYLDGGPPQILGKTQQQMAQHKHGNQFPIDLTINPMYIGDDVNFIAVIRDITERKAAEEEIRRLALTDSLTGLANRNAFNNRFDEAIAQSKRRETHLALLMIDLDKFKPVNDQYGHPVGDALLVEVAECLRAICRETDIVARLGGDEFAAVLTDLDDTENAHLPAEKIIAALSKPMMVLGQTVQIGASIGIAYFPADADNKDALVTLADDALYAAKGAGRNTFRIHGQAAEEA